MILVKVTITGTLSGLAADAMPADAKLQKIAGMSDAYELTDSAGDSLVDLGVIPYARLAKIAPSGALGDYAVVDFVLYADGDAGEFGASSGVWLDPSFVKIGQEKSCVPPSGDVQVGRFALYRDGCLVLRSSDAGIQRLLIGISRADEDLLGEIVSEEQADGASELVFSETVAVASAALSPGVVQLYDVSGGPITLTMPTVSSPNVLVGIKEYVIDAETVTISAGAASAIESPFSGAKGPTAAISGNVGTGVSLVYRSALDGEDIVWLVDRFTQVTV